MTQSPAASGQVALDPAQTRQCLAGSLAAYADYENAYTHQKIALPVPAGFDCLTRFTGWDGLIGSYGSEERYGLIYRSRNAPDTYLVAFRGTSSDMDAYEDIFANHVSFQPYGGKPLSEPVHVANGFYAVYTQKGDNMTGSMRDQVFGFLAQVRPAPRKVIVTGHSLGAAVANLFMLDMAASLPGVETVSTTFAAPRTGLESFRKAYEQTFKLTDRTFRVANYYDWVPSLPPHLLLGYDHVGQRFLVAFYLESPYYFAPVSCHSLLNYQTVLDHALAHHPQVWACTFKDAAQTYVFHKMYSVVPDVSAPDAEWAAGYHEVHAKYALAEPEG